MSNKNIVDSELPLFLEHLNNEFEVILFTQKKIVPFASLSVEERQSFTLKESRSGFPAKSYFLPAREPVATYGNEKDSSSSSTSASKKKPPALVNLRSCDLNSLTILDQVFLSEDQVDPFYEQKRNSTLIVSVDCHRISEFCFCTTLGYKPYRDKGMGLHLFPLKDGYQIQADTAQGEKILQSFSGGKAPSGDGRRPEIEQNRREVMEALAQNNEKFTSSRSYYEILKENAKAEKWNDLFNTCVECAACTNICPTCFCFYLFDQAKFPERKGTFQRLKSWDSCLLADYSRMAGVGGVKPNPRARIRSRYENRIRHKYQYHYETYGQYACTGCGRCSEACLGATDPREVMRVLGQ